MFKKPMELFFGEREKEDIKRYMEDYLHTDNESYAIHQLISLALEVYRYKSCKDLLNASEHILNNYPNKKNGPNIT